MVGRNLRRLRTRRHTPLSLMLVGIGIGIFLSLAFYGLDDSLPANLPRSEDGLLVITALDVGQGDATLIQTAEFTMLVDCGERGGEQQMDAYLNELGVSRIDAFLITHPHSDHMGISPHIIDNYEVGEILMPYIPDDILPTTSLFSRFLDSAEKSNAITRTLEVGDVIDLGSGAYAKVLGPVRDDYSSLNDCSAILLVSLGEASFLLTGDAESPAERDLVEAGALTPVDLLFAGHHGSRGSSTRPFLAVLEPKVVVISLGADNSYGHPHKEAIERIEEIGAKIYRTDVDGSVTITTDGSTIEIAAQNRQESLAA